MEIKRIGGAVAFTAELDITRTTSNREDPYVSIAVGDATSGCEILKLKVPMATLALALTGLSGQKVEGTYYADCPVNARYEHKTVDVEVPEVRYGGQDDAARGILAPHETDGWVGRGDDLWNSHKHVPGRQRVQRVHFGRYVDATTGEPILR